MSWSAIHMSCNILFGGRTGITFSPKTLRRSRKRFWLGSKFECRLKFVDGLSCLSGEAPVPIVTTLSWAMFSSWLCCEPSNRCHTSSMVICSSRMSSSGNRPWLTSTCKPRVKPFNPPIASKNVKSLGSYSLLPSWVFVNAKGLASCSPWESSVISNKALRSIFGSPTSDAWASVGELGAQPDQFDVLLPLEVLENERRCVSEDGIWRTLLVQLTLKQFRSDACGTVGLSLPCKEEPVIVEEWWWSWGPMLGSWRCCSGVAPS